MINHKKTYEDLENKIKSLELELTKLRQNIPKQDYEDFAKYSPSNIDRNALDITQRKEAELALKESEERFKNYINSTSDIVFTLDTEQRHVGIFGDWAESKLGNGSQFIFSIPFLPVIS
ncbi:MAG: PAS domain-containing protein [Leptospiraceae bacterium]|nr:PAS domain-containing protein [Leptospiraceae bacterium]